MCCLHLSTDFKYVHFCRYSENNREVLHKSTFSDMKFGRLWLSFDFFFSIKMSLQNLLLTSLPPVSRVCYPNHLSPTVSELWERNAGLLWNIRRHIKSGLTVKTLHFVLFIVALFNSSTPLRGASEKPTAESELFDSRDDCTVLFQKIHLYIFQGIKFL